MTHTCRCGTHRTASGEHGRCRNPATMNTRHGTPFMHHRNGMWRGPEMTPEQKTAAYGNRTPRQEHP